MVDFEKFERLVGDLLHLGSHVVIRPDADRSEESAQHSFERRVRFGAGVYEVIRDDAQESSQIEEPPDLLAPDPQTAGRCWITRVAFAGNNLDESRFAAPVRPENRDVLAGVDGEGDTAQSHFMLRDYSLVTLYPNILKFDQFRHR